ncbi:hypothetical protein DFJ73DRAFT_821173 [Zopfochytrium polystomum]|nr:hypothetical protein DFJ73DRAFT_821173 [Zopfochytrium polystomum]
MLSAAPLVLLTALGVTALAASPSGYDVAAGAKVSASSVNFKDTCATVDCGPGQVLNNNGLGGDIANPAQWVSAYGSCGPLRNETLTVDWSGKYGTQLLSEVRFRFGNGEAQGVTLVLFSAIPMNVPIPTAVTYENDANWMAYVFTEAVTASGMVLTFSGLRSLSSEADMCFVSVVDVQAWTGNSPDSLTIPSAPPRGPSGGTIAGIIIALLLIIAVGALVFWFLRTRRANLIKSRIAREAKLRRRQTADALGESQREGAGASPSSTGASRFVPLDDDSSALNLETVATSPRAKPLSPRTVNYLEAQARDDMERLTSAAA